MSNEYIDSKKLAPLEIGKTYHYCYGHGDYAKCTALEDLGNEVKIKIADDFYGHVTIDVEKHRIGCK